MRRTAIVVWDDDTSGNEFTGAELAGSLARADEDGRVLFALIEEGVTTDALDAGADPSSWEV